MSKLSKFHLWGDQSWGCLKKGGVNSLEQIVVTLNSEELGRRQLR